jgi:effector-binding domain-containing protein
MIVKIGVKTLTNQLVAYHELKPGESEAEAFAKLNAEAHMKGAKVSDPTMIIYYDPRDTHDCRREVLVPVDKDAQGLKTKKLPELRAGFIVYSGASHPAEHYYEELRKHLEQRGLKPASHHFCSMEAIYQPDTFGLSTGSFIDEDAQEVWTTEILIPIEG